MAINTILKIYHTYTVELCSRIRHTVQMILSNYNPEQTSLNN